MKFMKKNGGFTLVELIVVIAILAILAGVAVPAYSGYVEKANKQADITLVRDVANALQLHYYDTGAKSGGVVTLSRQDVTIPDGGSADAFGQAAMIAAFGENWQTAMSLKHDWNANLAGASSTTIAPEKILGTTSSLTNVAAAVVGSNNPSTATGIIVTLLNGDENMRAELQQYEGETEYATIATNLMIKYISDEIGNMTVNEDGSMSEINGPSNVALTYAVLYSMANSDSDYAYAAQQKIDAFDMKMEELKQKEQADPTGTSVSNELKAALDDMMENNPLVDQNGKAVMDENGEPLTFGPVYDSYMAENGMTDLAGIVDAMGFVGDVSKNYSDAESLSNKDLYAGDVVQSQLSDYQNANKYGVVVRIDAQGVISVMPVEANPFV